MVRAATAWTVTLAVAVAGAFVTGSNLGLVVGSVEEASAQSGGFLERMSQLFPLGYAFSVGMVSSVNPCGFAMLPAYLGLFLGETTAGQPQDVAMRFQRAVLVGASVTAGFVVLFMAAGLPIGFGAQWLVDLFPWVGIGIGIALAFVGAYLLAGGNLYNDIAMRMSSRIGSAGDNGVRGYFTFGLAYGTASLSCTLPLFLVVIGGTFTARTFLDSLLQFLLYAFGMGTVILVLTVGMAVFKGAMVGSLRRILPYVGTISAVMLLVSGAFIVYYWLTVGGLLERVQTVF